MATVLEEYSTEEQNSVVRFCVQKDSMQRIFMKKCFMFTLKSVSCSQLGGKRFADDEVETEVQKWLKQQSKHFYAVHFDAQVNRWDKCISVGGGYVEKYFFFQFRMSHVLRFISICDLFTDSPS
jgi:hypothetical protein